MNGSELLQKARAATKAARDFVPVNGEHYDVTEVEELSRRCRDAYLACRDARTSIGAMRLALYREEREEHRAKLERICTEFKAAALARVEGRGK